MSLDLTRLSLRFAAQPVLFAPLTLHVPRGTITTVTGPSGIGKSTLLDAIAGTLPGGVAMSGGITLNGQDITGQPAHRRRIGLLFQDAVLFGHLSVGDNLAFGLSPDIRGRAARRKAVTTALEQAGLGDMASRDPATLSGGQKARVALMRSLLADPQALLLDEPFSKLDAELRDEVRSFTFAHVRARGIPVLLVTHDHADAQAAQGPIVALGGRRP
ncbi:ATP-binding cassette domain-containing protein [Pseudooceanicola sediminis]|uniref:ATP-binding cassette domain-containing protein n=1 Tax=Pseudooceanicola sediminis TaxID=2211117 RepID=A0A399J0W3_9RHOB|nr:ATP-binding cassette domain-containing protein [Pseudooceanicola sediminis]KAA2315085.1 ATP-binding cassette domain-containing protein [Puniceibacterium sp. HSS470]RII38900.1 ATP-binding cassette domain-containing protein [Pseudooceanicola sediminis]|tara:strand:+ start:32107 stop:32754 length:648 start_codon:yes stop_codon:yes gene_type:complete